MPEFSVGAPPVRANGSAPSPVILAESPTLLPHATDFEDRRTVEGGLKARIEDFLRGRSEFTAPEEKGLDKGLEKLLRMGTKGNAFMDMLTGDSKVGAPDPDNTGTADQFTQEYLLGKPTPNEPSRGVVMLAMWTADP